jgi:hypothetical protein
MNRAKKTTEDKQSRVLKERNQASSQRGKKADGSITNLQKLIGNRAVQRLIHQRQSDQSFELDQDTANRVDKERGSGQTLDRSVQEKMGTAMGYDFSDVHVHTSPEADALNQDLSAQAFTTGNDIYFREGAYDPNSSSGQELLAHEMTHVVQQSGGMAGGGTKMTVNAPGDAYEKKADAVAQAVTNAPGAGQRVGVQRQELPEEEELQTKRVNRQEMTEEEKKLLESKEKSTEVAEEEKKLPEGKEKSKKNLEEDELQMKSLQRQEVPEEEELQMKRVKR